MKDNTICLHYLSCKKKKEKQDVDRYLKNYFVETPNLVNFLL